MDQQRPGPEIYLGALLIALPLLAWLWLQGSLFAGAASDGSVLLIFGGLIACGIALIAYGLRDRSGE